MWHTLLNLETIKERNKVKEAPQVPKDAPFILSSTLTAPRVCFVLVIGVIGVYWSDLCSNFFFQEAPVFNAITDSETEAGPVSSRIVDFSKIRPKTKFVSLLEKCGGDKNCMINFLIFQKYS